MLIYFFSLYTTFLQWTTQGSGVTLMVLQGHVDNISDLAPSTVG